LVRAMAGWMRNSQGFGSSGGWRQDTRNNWGSEKGAKGGGKFRSSVGGTWDRGWAPTPTPSWGPKTDGGGGGLAGRMESLTEMIEYREWKAVEEQEKKEKLQKEKEEREAKEWEAEQRKKDSEKFREEMRKDQETFFAKVARTQKRARVEEEEEPESEGDYKDKLRGGKKREKAQTAAAPVDVETWKDWTCGPVNAKAVQKAFPGTLAVRDMKGLSLLEMGEALQEKLGDRGMISATYRKVFKKDPVARWAKLDIIMALLGSHCEPEEE
jgi:flagellar biosynthesis GTPase FlhF